MKRFSVFLAILFCSLILGLAFVSCDDGSTGGSNNPNPITCISTDTAGNTYILIIMVAQANTIAPGNGYELTIKSGQASKVSKGTITVVVPSNGTLTMQPRNGGSDTFTVVVTTSGKMTNISGTIAVEGGGSVTAPGQVTPEGGSDGGGSGNGNEPTAIDGIWVNTAYGILQEVTLAGSNWSLKIDGNNRARGTITLADPNATTGKATITVNEEWKGSSWQPMTSKTVIADYVMNSQRTTVTFSNLVGDSWFNVFEGTWTKK